MLIKLAALVRDRLDRQPREQHLHELLELRELILGVV